MNTIGAIRIYLGAVYTERAEIGLYTPAVGNSELRWSEAPLYGVSDTYNYSMLLKNGIGSLTSSIDDTYGGNQETVNDIDFVVTGAVQLPLRLQELNIQLSGKTVEYIEFVGTDADSDFDSVTVMGTFTIEDMSGNEFETRFTAKSSFVLKRNKMLATRLSASVFPDAVGDVIPVTFGRSDPASGRFFKVPRIEYRSDILRLEDFLGSGIPGNITLFPAFSSGSADLDADGCNFLIGEGNYPVEGAVTLVGKYLKDSEGDAVENDGVIRKISAYTLDDVAVSGYPTQFVIGATLSEYFFKKVTSYHTGSLTWKSFVSVIDALLRYALDYVASEGFLSGIDFYVRENESMIRVVDIGVSQAVSNIPDYQLSVSTSVGEVGDTSSFKIIPVTALEPYLNADSGLEQYGLSTYHHPLDLSSDPVAGLFVEDSSTCTSDAQGVITNPTNFNDRDFTSWYRYVVGVDITALANNFNYYLGFKLTLPEIDETVQFDKVYLGIRMKSVCIDNGGNDPELTVEGNFVVAHRRYYGDAEKPVENETIEYNVESTVESLPDDYYLLHAPSTKNKAFYYAEDTVTLSSGYTTFDLGIADREAYNNIYEFLILMMRWGVQGGIADHIDDNVNFYELAIIFEKNITVGEELYA